MAQGGLQEVKPELRPEGSDKQNSQSGSKCSRLGTDCAKASRQAPQCWGGGRKGRTRKMKLETRRASQTMRSLHSVLSVVGNVGGF